MDEKKIATLDLLSFEPRQCAGLFFKKVGDYPRSDASTQRYISTIGVYSTL
jgi:hypothetical protein